MDKETYCYCCNCGTKIPSEQKKCPSCGADSVQQAKKSDNEIVKALNFGIVRGFGCFLSIIGSILLLIGMAFVVGSCESSIDKEIKKKTASLYAINEEQAKNGEELILTFKKAKEKETTELMREDLIAKNVGKTVLICGKVCEVSKTSSDNYAYKVKLAVDGIEVDFFIEDRNYDETEKIRSWKKDEIHTLRGQFAVDKAFFGKGEHIANAEVIE